MHPARTNDPGRRRTRGRARTTAPAASLGIGLGAVLAALLAAPGSAAGQTPAADATVEGSWAATWAQAIRTSGSEVLEIQRWGEARLTLQQDGEAVEGTWWTEAGGVTWKVAGTLHDGRLSLRADEHDSDDPQLDVIAALELRGTVSGDRIEGEMWLVWRAGRTPARRPWRAERVPAG